MIERISQAVTRKSNIAADIDYLLIINDQRWQ